MNGAAAFFANNGNFFITLELQIQKLKDGQLAFPIFIGAASAIGLKPGIAFSRVSFSPRRTLPPPKRAARSVPPAAAERPS